VARFDGGTMTSDAGAVLLRETDRRLGLLPRLAGCFEDRRQPWLISHTVQEMVAQRVYALALGYEDLTDHDQLREDPLLAVLSGKQRVGEEPLAGKSTLNRLELGGEVPSRYKKIHYREEAIDELLTNDRPAAARSSGGPLLPRLLRQLLLPAAVHLRRRAPAVRAAADGGSRRGGRQPRRVGADRTPNPGSVARGANHRASRLRLLPRGVDAMV
jgi:hypothetical protein